ncbi:MAG TPA: VOC family protein [Chloroflexota bacterium]
MVWFGLRAENPERAADFYSRVFAWTLEESTHVQPPLYWHIYPDAGSAPGVHGGLSPMKGFPSIVVDVPSLEEYGARIVANGGQLDMPMVEISGLGYVATYRDTEGNVIGILERLPPEQSEQPPSASHRTIRITVDGGEDDGSG